MKPGFRDFHPLYHLGFTEDGPKRASPLVPPLISEPYAASEVPSSFRRPARFIALVCRTGQVESKLQLSILRWPSSIDPDAKILPSPPPTAQTYAHAATVVLPRLAGSR